MKCFASILQKSLSQFTSLGQLQINETNQKPAEEDQEFTGISRIRAKTYVEHSGDESAYSKNRFVGSSGQHESGDEDTTITRAYLVSENDEDNSVSIPDQTQVCHDVAELYQPEQAEHDKVDQQQGAFLDDICQNFKGK